MKRYGTLLASGLAIAGDRIGIELIPNPDGYFGLARGCQTS
jgi:hypothetical protein